MKTFLRLKQPILRSRRMLVAGIALTLAILAVTIYLGTVWARHNIRAQITGRDAEILHAVALMQQLAQEPEHELGGQLEDVADQFAVLLHISQLNGVIAARLFDPQGRFVLPFPAQVAEGRLGKEDLHALQGLRPVSHFLPAASPAELFVHSSSQRSLRQHAPILEVNIPLHRKDQPRLLGVIQFFIDGQSIAAEYRALDRSLFTQALVAFLAGSIIIVAGLSWAFRRLQRTGELLLARTERLVRANHELAMAARTSAVGAVTAHLVHGLSNPLSGLHEFVAGRGHDQPAEADWQEAITSTGQMQDLIAEIVRIISEDHGLTGYEVNLPELAQMLSDKLAPTAQAAGIQLETAVSGDAVLPNREANLALLILENLLRNAVQATRRGGAVRLRIAGCGEKVAFEVEDEGAGIPPAQQPFLFKPCRSTKAGGSGIGLAICSQLANHLGAHLVLQHNTPQGCLFTLTLRGPKSAAKPPLASRLPLG